MEKTQGCFPCGYFFFHSLWKNLLKIRCAFIFLPFFFVEKKIIFQQRPSFQEIISPCSLCDIFKFSGRFGNQSSSISFPIFSPQFFLFHLCFFQIFHSRILSPIFSPSSFFSSTQIPSIFSPSAGWRSDRDILAFYSFSDFRHRLIRKLQRLFLSFLFFIPNKKNHFKKPGGYAVRYTERQENKS